MRHLFIINPAAGKHTDPEQLSQAIRQVMKEYTGRYAIRLTTHRHHAENMIRGREQPGASAGLCVRRRRHFK